MTVLETATPIISFRITVTQALGQEGVEDGDQYTSRSDDGGDVLDQGVAGGGAGHKAGNKLGDDDVDDDCHDRRFYDSH